jgi:hypothetical protein
MTSKNSFLITMIMWLEINAIQPSQRSEQEVETHLQSHAHQTNRAGHVQGAGGKTPRGEDKVAQRWQLAVHLIYPLLQHDNVVGRETGARCEE